MEIYLAMKTKTINQKLIHLPLGLKLSYLLINATVFFPVYIKEINFLKYFILMLSYIFFSTLIYKKLCGDKALFTVLALWFTGMLFYAITSVIFITFDLPVSFQVTFSNPLYKIFYMFLYPFRLLGVFITGLIFIQSLSPVQFLKFGKTGLKIAFILRAISFATDELQSNKQALIMSGLIPDDTEIKKDKKKTLHFLLQSPLLVTLTIRNLFMWIFWVIQYYKKLEDKEEK